MAQKIDVCGLFIDPETITDLLLQKRISVFYPVFYEIPRPKTLFNRNVSDQQHLLRFDHHEPYGIILNDVELPDSSSYVVKYKEAFVDKLFKSVEKAGKSVVGHTADFLKIDISGDRQYRILQSGRNEKQISIREIPAKVCLLSGQWVDVFKSSPGYDFQGGSPYPTTDIGTYALTITTTGNKYILYGAGVDVANEEVLSAYKILTETVNQIQAKRDAAISEQSKKQLSHKSGVLKQLPKAELPKINLPQIKFQSPLKIEKKAENPSSESLTESSTANSSSTDSQNDS